MDGRGGQSGRPKGGGAIGEKSRNRFGTLEGPKSVTLLVGDVRFRPSHRTLGREGVESRWGRVDLGRVDVVSGEYRGVKTEVVEEVDSRKKIQPVFYEAFFLRALVEG